MQDDPSVLTRRSDGGVPPPVAQDAAPDGPPLTGRRTVLRLALTGGATAAALHLTSPRPAAAKPSHLDPASALHIGLVGLAAGTDRAAATHRGHQPPAAGQRPDEPSARVWSRLITVTLLVRNTAPTDVLFSPGQVRLRLADGTGVMPVESEWPAGPAPAFSTRRTWVRFLAPDDGSPVSVDYTPAGAVEAVPLTAGAGVGHGHGGAR